VTVSGWVAQDDTVKIAAKLATPALSSALPLLTGVPFLSAF
jgi:hypothetical protein